uniref:Doublesex- and mab-3-related transcription factor C1/C2 C-terminal domain-containing protein n=1 Tax=Equus caballus TaxID=9796 RepID=A0A9L0S4A9_HORSE
GAAPPKAHRRVEKLAIQGGVPTGKENIMPQLEAHPCATFEEAPKASDRDLGPASSEWQRKLEAAEALLTLRYSSQAPSGSTSLLQPCAAPGSLDSSPPSPSPRPRLVSSISLPIGHLGCISLLK